MIVEVTQLTSFQLKMVLTKSEAVWLKAVLQNAAGSGEPPEAGAVRSEIFNALVQAGVK